MIQRSGSSETMPDTADAEVDADLEDKETEAERERERSLTPIETSEDNSEASTETPPVVEIQETPDTIESIKESHIGPLLPKESRHESKKERSRQKQNRERQDTSPHSNSSSSASPRDFKENGRALQENSLSATLPDVCVPAASSAQRQSKQHHNQHIQPHGTPSPPAEPPSLPRRTPHLRAEIPPR